MSHHLWWGRVNSVEVHLGCLYICLYHSFSGWWPEKETETLLSSWQRNGNSMTCSFVGETLISCGSHWATSTSTSFSSGLWIKNIIIIINIFDLWSFCTLLFSSASSVSGHIFKTPAEAVAESESVAESLAVLSLHKWSELLQQKCKQEEQERQRQREGEKRPGTRQEGKCLSLYLYIFLFILKTLLLLLLNDEMQNPEKRISIQWRINGNK